MRGDNVWRRAFFAVVVAAALVVGGPAATAVAGGQNSPMIGDVDGDGLADRATLVADGPGQCAVRVELAEPGGGYGAPATYTWPDESGIGYCPDMGVVVDLESDGAAELVVGWFWLRPPGYPTELIVLRDFTPAGGFDALYQPSYIGVSDFNGDGRPDIYEYTDQGDGFVTFLNTGPGELVPGPVNYACFDPFTHELTDFDGDGATDVLLPFGGGLEGVDNGVVILRDGGQRLYLHQLDDEYHAWNAAVVDADSDGTRDVRTVDETTGEVTHFIGDGLGGFAESPVATTDVVQVPYLGQKTISILVNDVVTSAVTFDIVTPPTQGVIVKTNGKGFVYRNDVNQDDSFVYRLTQDGKSVTATAYLRIR